MLPFSVTIPATVPQRSEIPEGLMNYPDKITLLQYYAVRWLADANTKCPGVVVFNEN